MFIRKVENITEPYVTLEFKERKVIQCRSFNNSKPNDNVVNFVNDWCKKFELKSFFS